MSIIFDFADIAARVKNGFREPVKVEASVSSGTTVIAPVPFNFLPGMGAVYDPVLDRWSTVTTGESANHTHTYSTTSNAGCHTHSFSGTYGSV